MRGEPSVPDDEVDLLIDAWSRRLPDLDLSPLDIMSRLRRVALGLNRLRVAAFSSAGLAPWEFDVLAALRRAESPHELSPAVLIERTRIGSAAMTNRIENLLARGMISRRPNPHDGRGVLVRLTDEGANVVDLAMTELVRREEVELRSIGPEDRAALIRILRVLVDESPRE
ncbi:MarR family winged helix-turn-helix transcriptional regulator [Microbacterium rhizomatis]|uniref:Winged helix-turn-helix transcriptional regulator n=1 Tax=Microbacterium rhizomatis TaxID=1631477 RepID=A0A5J5J039_9MICO|nr:MarR family winged helix-turn-helix transcriptional regulator [Microbacterium rhizomatis]KAA9107916.1 winged helix-turn-helix transcriptional regulator [Microbacterium rhizomatis]